MYVFLVKLFVFPDSFNCLRYCFVSILLTVAAYFFGLILISYSWLIKSIQNIHILLEYFLLLSSCFNSDILLSKHMSKHMFLELLLIRYLTSRIECPCPLNFLLNILSFCLFGLRSRRFT